MLDGDVSICVAVIFSRKGSKGLWFGLQSEHMEVYMVTIQYNTIQYNTIQYNTIQYNTIQYNTIQYNTIQYNIWSAEWAYESVFGTNTMLLKKWGPQDGNRYQ